VWGGLASAAAAALRVGFGLSKCVDPAEVAAENAAAARAQQLAAAEEEPVDVAAAAVAVAEGLAAEGLTVAAEWADGGEAAAAVAERLAEGLTAVAHEAISEHGRDGDGVSCCSAL